MPIRIASLILALWPLIVLGQVQEISEIFSPNPYLYPLDRFVKVAVLQWAPKNPTPVPASEAVATQFKQSLSEEISVFVKQAALNQAKLIVTPEFSTVGYPETPDGSDNFRNPEEIAPYAEFLDGPTFQYFSKLAYSLKIAIVVSIVERTNVPNEFFNTALFISSEGKLITSYRKVNLFGGERNFLKPGRQAVIAQTAVGRVAFVICADLYGTSPMREYIQAKVDVLISPVSWTIHNSAYSYYQRAAKKLEAYVIAANHTYYPDSGVVSPDGTKQSHIRQSSGLAYGFIPLRK